jgi:hypothetical protein
MLFTPVVIIMGILLIIFLVLVIVLFRKGKTAWALLLIILACGAGIYAYKEYNRGNRDLGKTRPDVQIRAMDLIREYEASDSIANKKYLGRILEVEGNVKGIERDADGFYTVILGDTAQSSAVRCSMDTVYREDAARLRAGSSAIIRGACTGFKKNDFGIPGLGSDVELNRCAVIEK